jgi:hypothetical protein
VYLIEPTVDHWDRGQLNSLEIFGANNVGLCHSTAG